MMEKSKQRIIYVDILKIVAIMGVIILHSAAPLTYQLNSIKLSWWWISNFFESSMRWAVPIFVMVSGMLLLDPKKEESIKIFLIKRFNRVLIPFIFWGIVYTIWNYKYIIVSKQSLPILKIIESFITGPIYFHLWYIYIILGLYISTPIIRIYIKNTDIDNLKYFLIIWFITNGVFNFIQTISGIKIGINLNFFLGYVGYFILGYYLHITKFNKKQINYVYFLSLICFIVTIIGTFILTKTNDGILKETFYEYLSPNVILMSIGIFIFIKNFNWIKLFENRNSLFGNININNIILEVSSLSFGIYLIHPLIMLFINLSILPIKINAMLINPLFGIPFTALLTLLISFVILKVLKKFSLSKYIM